MHLKPSVPTQRVCILPRSLLLGPPTLGVVPCHVAAEAAGRPETHATDVAYLAVADAVNHLLRTGEAIGPFSSGRPAAVESPQPRVDSTRKAGIHALGENESDLLAAYEPDEDTTLRLQRQAASVAAASGHVVVLGSANTSGVTIQPSLTQVAFKLSSVFDPSSAADAALFDLEDGSETDTALSSAASEENLLGANARLENDMALDPEDLDAELDALLGGDEAFWNASEALKKRWRSRDAASATKTAEDIWAVHDNVDVTDFGSLVPDPALQYPFDLDVFQRRAIFRLERNENVFVAAHTSAGKTVVAEYAIAMAQRNRTKVIYTSPIKTLSNQKFRDFTDRFGDVGLITGDVSLNPEAGVLVMTTEILRSMLYRGADIIRDLEFVIFDEVHWASDPERGVVWEESIILLPESCGIVMLSATVPNAIEFANWVGRTKRRSVYVVSTMKRPVPLVHSLFVKSEPYPLYDTNKGQFMHVNYKAAAEKQAAISRNSNVRFGGGRHHAWMPLIKYLRKHELDPAIVFCFSKRKCEEAADSLYSTDLTAGASEKNQIHHFYQTSIARLSPADQRVPQIARCLDSLKRGIGVHHAGILPIVKEVTEVLFQRGLVRVLFCTETFAVGVNAPAR
jgi:superfamily II RNA helicase